MELHDPNLKHILSEALQPPDGDDRPLLLLIAGPNGSGKTTLFEALNANGQQDIFFINADILAQVVGSAPAADKLAQRVADVMREHFVQQNASFATETVFSDTVGAKLQLLRDARNKGMRIVMVYVTLASWQLSMARVGFRVAEHQGHDVPSDKLPRRFTASADNARAAAAGLVDTAIFVDNSAADRRRSFRPMAVVQNGQTVYLAPNAPGYVKRLLPPDQSEAGGFTAEPGVSSI